MRLLSAAVYLATASAVATSLPRSLQTQHIKLSLDRHVGEAKLGAVLRVPRGGAAADVPKTKSIAPEWLRPCAAELAGTALIVFGGCGVGAAAAVTGSMAGAWQGASVWGWSVALAVYCTMHLSGAHLNPALTLAFKVIRPGSISWAGAGRYVVAQLAGAALAAQAVLTIWGGPLAAAEKKWAVIRGLAGSERSASVLTLFFPSPGAASVGLVSPLQALMFEAMGTGLLSFVVFSMTHPKNKTLGENKSLLPLVIGFTVAVLGCLFGPLTGGGFNPARDLGPRLVTYMAGWGRIALPGAAGAYWIYTLGPLIGGLVGGFLATRLNE